MLFQITLLSSHKALKLRGNISQRGGGGGQEKSDKEPPIEAHFTEELELCWRTYAAQVDNE